MESIVNNSLMAIGVATFEIHALQEHIGIYEGRLASTDDEEERCEIVNELFVLETNRDKLTNLRKAVLERHGWYSTAVELEIANNDELNDYINCLANAVAELNAFSNVVKMTAY